MAAHGVTVSRFSATPGDDRVDLRWKAVADRSQRRGPIQYVVWWREAGATGWNIYEIWSYYTRLSTTIAPREFWVRGGMHTGLHRDHNPEALKPGTSYDVRVYVGSGYTTKADGLVYATTVTTTGEAPSGGMQSRPPPEAVETKAKDAAIQVSGGTLARAVRVKKRKDLWELRVTPSGQGAVTVTLPATADCSGHPEPSARRTGGGWSRR